MIYYVSTFFFFFKQKTAYEMRISDWISDVCSSDLDILTALGLAAGLWLVILVVFFPIVGWGFAGLAVSPKLIPASFVPHLLFGLLLWALDKYLPSGSGRSEEHTSELQSLMRISYAVFCLKKKKHTTHNIHDTNKIN